MQVKIKIATYDGVLQHSALINQYSTFIKAVQFMCCKCIKIPNILQNFPKNVSPNIVYEK